MAVHRNNDRKALKRVTDIYVTFYQGFFYASLDNKHTGI